MESTKARLTKPDFLGSLLEHFGSAWSQPDPLFSLHLLQLVVVVVVVVAVVSFARLFTIFFKGCGPPDTFSSSTWLFSSKLFFTWGEWGISKVVVDVSDFDGRWRGEGKT